MATTAPTATANLSEAKVVEALQNWVDTNLPEYGYTFDRVEDDLACQAARRAAMWAVAPFDNEALYAAFVAGTADQDTVERLKQLLVSRHEAFELFAQTIAVRFFPGAAELTDDIRAEAMGYAIHAR